MCIFLTAPIMQWSLRQLSITMDLARWLLAFVRTTSMSDFDSFVTLVGSVIFCEKPCPIRIFFNGRLWRSVK